MVYFLYLSKARLDASNLDFHNLSDINNPYYSFAVGKF
jgi:hypothetical protein